MILNHRAVVSAIWAYESIMTGTMNALASSHAPDPHPSENFGLDIILLAPVAILALPLHMLGEAEIMLSSQFGK